jgi:phosphoglucomutase
VSEKAVAAIISPLAGKPVPASLLVDIPALLAAYFALIPDPAIPAQRVSFGTSGHRGCAFASSFNEAHVAAITQAICLYRKRAGISGPLFLGIDTHSVSRAAFGSVVEVLAANGVETMVDAARGFTPTPVISHAILGYNRSRTSGLADGIVITPSHNPPEDGGIKYNAANGGPSETAITGWIEAAANTLLAEGYGRIARIPYARARAAPCIHDHDYITPYVASLGEVVDMAAIASAGVRIGIDPLGGAAVGYWQPIIDHYGIDATVVDPDIDPAFGFMSLDWDGKVRMDCSSPFAMQRLLTLRDRFDIAFANDPDADRHGIVCPSAGLMTPNSYLVAAIAYLCANRPGWEARGAIGKTMVSSAMIDRIAAKLGRPVYEVPVGFKWFSAGLLEGSLVFAGEESAGATFARRDGTVWTTDKDGMIMGLLAAEITAKTGADPAQFYASATAGLGVSHYARIDAPSSALERSKLAALTAADLEPSALGHEAVTAILDHAPGNDAPFGGIKVMAKDCWFAARPSGTENIYKLYAEPFGSEDALEQLQHQGRALIEAALAKKSAAQQR